MRPNELLLTDILEFSTKEFSEKLKDVSQHKGPLYYYMEEPSVWKSVLKYHKDLVNLITKKKSHKKGAISFYPKLKNMKKDKLFTSKLGGVPSCFYSSLIPFIEDKEKCYEILKVKYPKNLMGRYMNFVGEFDLTAPTIYMDSVFPSWDKDFPVKNLGGRSQGMTLKSSIGALFADEDSEYRSTCSSNGFFKSMVLDWSKENCSTKEMNLYIQIVKEFIEKEVKPHRLDNIENYKLQEITGWDVNLELSIDSNQCLVSTPKNKVFKIFGYPESEQRISDRYCVNGYFGPRLMTPFVTLMAKTVYCKTQVYADLLEYNTNMEGELMPIQTDMSGT